MIIYTHVNKETNKVCRDAGDTLKVLPVAAAGCPGAQQEEQEQKEEQDEEE